LELEQDIEAVEREDDVLLHAEEMLLPVGEEAASQSPGAQRESAELEAMSAEETAQRRCYAERERYLVANCVPWADWFTMVQALYAEPLHLSPAQLRKVMTARPAALVPPPPAPVPPPPPVPPPVPSTRHRVTVPSGPSRFGVEVRFGRVVISRAEAGASDPGVQVGDAVVRIGDRAVPRPATAAEMRRMLGDARKPFVMDLERGGEAITQPDPANPVDTALAAARWPRERRWAQAQRRDFIAWAMLQPQPRPPQPDPARPTREGAGRLCAKFYLALYVYDIDFNALFVFDPRVEVALPDTTAPDAVVAPDPTAALAGASASASGARAAMAKKPAATTRSIFRAPAPGGSSHGGGAIVGAATGAAACTSGRRAAERAEEAAEETNCPAASASPTEETDCLCPAERQASEWAAFPAVLLAVEHGGAVYPIAVDGATWAARSKHHLGRHRAKEARAREESQGLLRRQQAERAAAAHSAARVAAHVLEVEGAARAVSGALSAVGEKAVHESVQALQLQAWYPPRAARQGGRAGGAANTFIFSRAARGVERAGERRRAALAALGRARHTDDAGRMGCALAAAEKAGLVGTGQGASAAVALVKLRREELGVLAAVAAAAGAAAGRTRGERLLLAIGHRKARLAALAAEAARAAGVKRLEGIRREMEAAWPAARAELQQERALEEREEEAAGAGAVPPPPASSAAPPKKQKRQKKQKKQKKKEEEEKKDEAEEKMQPSVTPRKRKKTPPTQRTPARSAAAAPAAAAKYHFNLKRAGQGEEGHGAPSPPAPAPSPPAPAPSPPLVKSEECSSYA
jgi:hypothetical protein